MAVALRVWRCWRCPATFVHGRLLAGHLIDHHGEGR